MLNAGTTRPDRLDRWINSLVLTYDMKGCLFVGVAWAMNSLADCRTIAAASLNLNHRRNRYRSGRDLGYCANDQIVSPE